MTRIICSTTLCTACGKASRQITFVEAPEASLDHDLDTRAPGDAMEIQHCPHCHYCAEDISQPVGLSATEECLKEYHEILADTSIPPYATYHLASSCILSYNRYFYQAAWSALRAAWVCDDENLSDKSDACRQKALCYMGAYLHSDAEPTEQDLLVYVELFRRSGRFEDALDILEELLQKNLSSGTRKVHLFQQDLCLEEDSSSYTLRQAMERKN